MYHHMWQCIKLHDRIHTHTHIHSFGTGAKAIARASGGACAGAGVGAGANKYPTMEPNINKTKRNDFL